jgi:hypothetical protein
MSDYSSDSDTTLASTKYSATRDRRAGNKRMTKRYPHPTDSSSEEYESDREEEEKEPAAAVSPPKKKHVAEPEDEDDNDEQDAPLAGEFSLPGPDEQPKIFVMVGKCDSGKSHFLEYMMYVYGQRKQFKFGLCFTSTGFTGAYDYLPKKSVQEFDMDYLEEYVVSLRKRIEAGKAEHGRKWNLPHNFIIIDDSLGLVGNSAFFMNFVATHRHTRTTVFLLTQGLTAARSCNTVVRNNTNFAMMWPTPNGDAHVGLYKAYGTMCGKLSDFTKELNMCRERMYSCLVFKANSDYTTREQAYTRVLAPADIPEFQYNF